MQNFFVRLRELLKKTKLRLKHFGRRLYRLNIWLRRAIVLGGVLVCVGILVLIAVAVVRGIGGKAQVAAAEGEPTSSPVPTATALGYVPSDIAAPTPEPVTSGEAVTPPTQETPSPTSVLILKKHDKNEEVRLLQNRLMELGYLDLDEPTNYFGSGTEYAVELFQRQHGLQMDGIAGEQTLVVIYADSAQPYVLKEGAEGRDVKMLQVQLNELGYLEKSLIDSVYGPATIDAVKKFQKRNDLKQDGYAGEKTMEALYSDEAVVSYELYKKQQEDAKKDDDDDKKEEDKPSKIDRLISAAKSKIGCEYILGDRGPDTFDCSGFVYWCLRQAGVYCNRLNAAGFSKKTSWDEIKSISDIQKGDLLFFKSDSSTRVSHCGIYIGSGMMIDASSGNGEVVKRSVSSYWKRNFVNARRPW